MEDSKGYKEKSCLETDKKKKEKKVNLGKHQKLLKEIRIIKETLHYAVEKQKRFPEDRTTLRDFHVVKIQIHLKRELVLN